MEIMAAALVQEVCLQVSMSRFSYYPLVCAASQIRCVGLATCSYTGPKTLVEQTGEVIRVHTTPFTLYTSVNI